MEFGGPRYRRFAQSDQIRSYDIIDINPNNPLATIRCDVEDLCSVTGRAFDVIVCTQVLQYVKNPARALSRLKARLKPQGVLLVTAPFIERQDRHGPDRWRFTKLGMESLLQDFSDITVETGGNLFATLCYLAGFGLNDVDEDALLLPDDIHYTTVMARAKP